MCSLVSAWLSRACLEVHLPTRVMAHARRSAIFTLCLLCFDSRLSGLTQPLFKPCFDKIDAMCASDVASEYSFCNSIKADDTHGMMHVIEVLTTLWTHTSCSSR